MSLKLIKPCNPLLNCFEKMFSFHSKCAEGNGLWLIVQNILGQKRIFVVQNQHSWFRWICEVYLKSTIMPLLLPMLKISPIQSWELQIDTSICQISPFSRKNECPIIFERKTANWYLQTRKQPILLKMKNVKSTKIAITFSACKHFEKRKQL